MFLWQEVSCLLQYFITASFVTTKSEYSRAAEMYLCLCMAELSHNNLIFNVDCICMNNCIAVGELWRSVNWNNKKIYNIFRKETDELLCTTE